MEALSRLERVQSMLAFHRLSWLLLWPRSPLRSLSRSSPSLLRISLTVQPCGMLSVEKKYSLALDFFNKIKCITDAEKCCEALSRKLDPSLSMNYCRRCEEATQEGGLNNSMNAYGMWSILPLILDEDAFCAQNT